MLVFLAICLGVSVLCNAALFLVAFRFKTDKLTDASYALTFIALTAFAFFSAPVSGAKFLLAGMVKIWALRLGGFLLMRIWRTGKDGRFDAIRGDFRKFGKFWLAQGLSVWIIMLAALLGLHQQQFHPPLWAWGGVVVWLTGVIIEATADLQKYRFSRNPANKNRWIDDGVWHYSRHPNYFGEILTWAGLYLFVAGGLSAAAAWVALLSPLYITCLLLFVSGLPPLEKGADKRWGHDAAYQNYKRHTSILVPWFPKDRTQ